ncbi:putative glycerol:H+ symporter [Xylona heveae TC161]|uniref:Putative glycerol:H+ symporter n=1 Tax=Xylona heveae (strain CBS 132557 / TC161) TaxID=1328760 RepID=A0A165I4K4_XYLHT|nr:putative glycerol:H+ symporter [Xylona heveae TC161]KZF24373.1 putative glycerol:H+ symporter [Xylona heveae TC161]
MSWLLFLKRLYSLDTLDTRFTTSSKTPSKIAALNADERLEFTRHVQDQDSSKPAICRNASAQVIPEGSSPSRWRTPEFYVYYIVFIIVVPMMFKVTYDVSKESDPNYPKYKHLLSPGWILGRKVDNSDLQYASFRSNVPYLLIVLTVHPFLRRLYNYFNPVKGNANAVKLAEPGSTSQNGIDPITLSTAADARLEQRIRFDVIFAGIFLCALHGFSAFKVLVILAINFGIAKRLPKEYIPVTTWVFNISILFANELCEGYRFSHIVSWFAPASPADPARSDNWGAWLDSYGGLIPRWEVLFNITVLRLISFNLDYYWSLDLKGGSPIEKKQLDPSNLSERDRIAIPAKPQDFCWINYIAYTLYSPLYLAGPILTFNDFIAQLRYPAPSITTSRTVLYGIRFFLALLTMEFMLHFIYAVAISKSQPAWEVYTPFQLSMLGYFNLHIIWLKLLLPWRFFRFWALVDGIDPPENMVRCMSNNPSALAFWRAWHRSYNKWIVRYIYIPLGGSATRGPWGTVRTIVNSLVVFTFVALWHDINLKLLMWGWLITLFILPEILARFLFPPRKWQNRKEMYRVICGIGAVGNILMMMAANLVGFAVGLDGLKDLVHGIIGSYSGTVCSKHLFSHV